MILTYSATTVTLRDPDLGDTETQESFAEIRRVRGGEVRGTDGQMLQSVVWDADETQVMAPWNKHTSQTDPPLTIVANVIRALTFKTLTRTIRDELEAFLIESAGAEITLDGTSGYIITPQVEFITVKDDCSYDVSFEFMER